MKGAIKFPGKQLHKIYPVKGKIGNSGPPELLAMFLAIFAFRHFLTRGSGVCNFFPALFDFREGFRRVFLAPNEDKVQNRG
jgi:hypothetical protein